MIGGIDVPVEFIASDAKEVVSSYHKLNRSILICSDKDGSYVRGSGRIFVIGEFVDGQPEEYRELKPDDPIGYERRKFIMRGWGIKTPYYEYPQHPDDGSLALAPVVRVDIKGNDFESKVDLSLMNYDSEKKIYWFGVKPE